MSKVKLALPIGEIPVNGKQVTFEAPCDCSAVECIQIDGVDYCVVDAMGNQVTGSSDGGVWLSGSKVSVILDVEKQRAYLLNGNVPPITIERIREICGSAGGGGGEPGGGGGSDGGTTDHRKLTNRSAGDQHPISAITGLFEALAGKVESSELQTAINAALLEAKENGAFNGESGLPAVVTLSGASHSVELSNNTDYRCADTIASLTVTGFSAGADGRSEVWSIQFIAGDGITVALPDTVIWNYGATPVFTAGSEYTLVFTPMLSGKVLGVWNEVEA